MQNNKVLNYTLLHQLGVGGMAEVWYAENEIGKKAAVKVLLPKFCADEAIVARFQNEAKVMVQLDHPNIRQAYDYTTVDGRPCMVMEYLEGDDLSSRMKHGERFTDEQLKKWWNQIADALNYTHAEGIVHRDLKPSNIFVDKKGNVKLLDFGIAKIKESISMTRTGAMMGTLMYMSPEQVMDTKHIDASTDLYSLAVTFVHLLMGKAPYDTTTTNDYEIRKNIVETPLDMTGIPAEWQNFLRPYLAKNPKERPALVPFGAGQTGGFVPSVAPASEETVVGGGAAAASVPSSEETVMRNAKASVQGEGTVVSQTSNPQSAGQKSAPQKPMKMRKGLIVGIIVVLLLGGGVALALLLGGRGSHQSYKSEDKAVVETESSKFGIMKDYDGNEYKTVQIGDQVWMAENLRTTHYSDGTYIPIGDGSSKSSTPVRYLPGCYDCSDNKESNVATYGYLYDWFAVMHGASSSNKNPSSVQGVCPDGWHVPSDEEWKQLELAVGMTPKDTCRSELWRGNIAVKLCGSEGWDYSDEDNVPCNPNAPDRNAFGFSALPAGTFDNCLKGGNSDFGHGAWFWTSTPHYYGEFAACSIRFSGSMEGVSCWGMYKRVGLSVRCIRD